MIGFFVRYSSTMRIFSPISKSLRAAGCPYCVFLPVEEELSRPPYYASEENINKCDSGFLSGAQCIRKFSRKDVKQNNLSDITKFFTIEAPLSEEFLMLLKNKKIKLYNMLYFTTSLFSNRKQVVPGDVIFYPTIYLRDKILEYHKMKYMRERDMLTGYSFFEDIGFQHRSSNNNSIIILVPSLRNDEQLMKAFGEKRRSRRLVIERLMQGLSKNYNLIIKTREKIKLTRIMRRSATSILYDDISINELMKLSNNVIMFYSNGIYEYLLAGANVINVPIKVKDKSGYFKSDSDSLFNWPGAVKYLGWEEAKKCSIIDTDYFTEEGKLSWIKNFIGLDDYNITEKIVKILSNDTNNL